MALWPWNRRRPRGQSVRALEALGEVSARGEVIDSTIQGAVSIHPTARVESSIIRGPAIIGAGVRLRDAYVGPYTSIGNDVLIEGAEVEHSIVMPEASIRHLGAGSRPA